MKGNITIGKVTAISGKREEDYLSIIIDDESSGIRFLEVKMSLLDFAQALTGSGYIPVEYKLIGLENIGKKHENKTVEVAIPKDQITLQIEDKDINKAVGEHEIDGWIGSREDCKNHHNLVRSFRGDGGDFWVYQVHFWRYVDVKEEQDA